MEYNIKTVQQSLYLYEKMKSFRKVEQLMKIGKLTICRWYHKFKDFVKERKRPKKRRYRIKNFYC